MPRKIEILNELKEISPLLGDIERDNPFRVPSQYFEELATNILSTVKNNELSGEELNTFDFAGIPAINHDLPENYFNTLSGKIFSRIKTEEEKEELNDFPVLNSLKGKNVFTVPEGYFDNNLEGIVVKINVEERVKVISIKRGKLVSMQSTWWKATAAAVIAGVVAISSWFALDNNSVAPQQTAYVSSQNVYKTSDQVSAAIASLSDDEIADYLEDHGNILDNDLLIEDVSTQGLPAPEDYLLDDNTLDEYLNEIGAGNALKLN